VAQTENHTLVCVHVAGVTNPIKVSGLCTWHFSLGQQHLHLLDVLYQNKQKVIVAHSVKTQVVPFE